MYLSQLFPSDPGNSGVFCFGVPDPASALIFPFSFLPVFACLSRLGTPGCKNAHKALALLM